MSLAYGALRGSRRMAAGSRRDTGDLAVPVRGSLKRQERYRSQAAMALVPRRRPQRTIPTTSLSQCAKRSTNDRAPPFRPPPRRQPRASHPATCARRCGCCAIRWRASTTAPPTARSNESSACSLPAPCCATSSCPTARGRRALGVRRSDHRPGALRLKLPRRLDAHHGPRLEPVRSTPGRPRVRPGRTPRAGADALRPGPARPRVADHLPRRRRAHPRRPAGALRAVSRRHAVGVGGAGAAANRSGWLASRTLPADPIIAAHALTTHQELAPRSTAENRQAPVT
jgi:hypothetical protein